MKTYEIVYVRYSEGSMTREALDFPSTYIGSEVSLGNLGEEVSRESSGGILKLTSSGDQS